MPLVPNFTASQVSGFPNIIVLTDASTGLDVTITERRVYLQQKNGAFIVPTGTATNYIVWAASNPTISIDVLKKDMALTIRVDYVTVLGAVVVTKTNVGLFTLYAKSFAYSLTQYQATNPTIVRDTNYFNNKAKLYSYILGAENAILIASDVAGAQLSLDEATNLITNPKNFF